MIFNLILMQSATPQTCPGHRQFEIQVVIDYIVAARDHYFSSPTIEQRSQNFCTPEKSYRFQPGLNPRHRAYYKQNVECMPLDHCSRHKTAKSTVFSFYYLKILTKSGK